jgi:hypothetical protein
VEKLLLGQVTLRISQRWALHRHPILVVVPTILRTPKDLLLQVKWERQGLQLLQMPRGKQDLLQGLHLVKVPLHKALQLLVYLVEETVCLLLRLPLALILNLELLNRNHLEPQHLRRVAV